MTVFALSLAVVRLLLAWANGHEGGRLDLLRKRIASLEAQTERAASTDFPPGE